MKRLFVVPLFLLFCNFGKFVHELINANVVKVCKKNEKFNDVFSSRRIKDFVKRSAEPDERKFKDHSERKKHYFHYDVYNSDILKNYLPRDLFFELLKGDFKKFVNTKLVNVVEKPEQIDKFIKKHGELHWSILDTIDKLKTLVNKRKELKEKQSVENVDDVNNVKKLRDDIEKEIKKCDDMILYECINLSHYIADLYTPLHLTIYYDGKYVSQTGLHMFWETLLPKYCNGDYKIKIIDLENKITKLGIELFILREMKNSYKLSEKIIEQESKKISLEYKRYDPVIYYKKRFNHNKYKEIANNYFHDDTERQISLAVSLISYIFNRIVFI